MKKVLTIIILSTVLLLVTGCSSKLYSYEKIVSESKERIANDIVIDNPGSFNRNNGLKAYTAYLERDKNKKITIINGKEYLLPVGQNYLCTDFAEVYLVPKFYEFKNKYGLNSLYDMKVESKNSALHPRCKDLKVTINCNNKSKYFNAINIFIEDLNKDGIYLNKTGMNRYDIYCQDGKQLFEN